MRTPNPVVEMARAKRNAENISHTVVLLNPDKTLSAGSVCVSNSSVAAITTLTPIGTGRATRAIIVPTKIAKRCCWGASNPGNGKMYSNAAGNKTIPQRRRVRKAGWLMGCEAEDPRRDLPTQRPEAMSSVVAWQGRYTTRSTQGLQRD